VPARRRFPHASRCASHRAFASARVRGSAGTPGAPSLSVHSRLARACTAPRPSEPDATSGRDIRQGQKRFLSWWQRPTRWRCAPFTPQRCIGRPASTRWNPRLSLASFAGRAYEQSLQLPSRA
jgi:hypothetical protein